MLALVIGIIITVLDQVTKYIVRLDFALGEAREVIPGFMDLTYLRNTGAAWGMLGGRNGSLIVLSVIMLLLLVIFRKSFLADTLDHRIALGLMLGGITGNLIDRVRLGWVTDFLDFYIGRHHWPAFNVADAAICTGVGIYILSTWLIARREARMERRELPDAGESADSGS
jgi:signal peptidase II